MSKCPEGDTHCGVYYTCGVCKDKMRQAIYARMSPERKAYDNRVDPAGAYHTDYDREGGCSCHISPPCSHCVESTHGGEGGSDD